MNSNTVINTFSVNRSVRLFDFSGRNRALKVVSTLFLAFFSLVYSIQSSAAAFGVAVAWKTDDPQAIFDVMPKQKKAFAHLIDAGYIHDMFVSESMVGGQSFPIIKFVMEAESADEVRKVIGNLPFQYKDLVEITEVREIGNKWLDINVAFKNYAIELEWKEPEDKMLVDQVIARDLQKVVDWSAQGRITSAYIMDTNIVSDDASEKMIRPIYSIAVLAKDETDAGNIAHELEAVKLGLANIHISELGFKLNL